MELTNFGSIMKFAIDRETDIKTMLSEAKKNEKLASMSEKVESMAATNQTNLKLLERTRREGICEMVLHPITGLDSNDYTFTATPVAQISPEEFSSTIKTACGKILKFYTEAADKLPADDAKRAFHKLAKKEY